MDAIMKQRRSWIFTFYKHAYENNCAILFGMVVRLIMCWGKREPYYLGAVEDKEEWLWNDILGVLLCAYVGEDEKTKLSKEYSCLQIIMKLKADFHCPFSNVAHKYV